MDAVLSGIGAIILAVFCFAGWIAFLILRKNRK
jgi:hypothetical protein